MKSAIVQARLEPQLKAEAERVFSEIGINASQAIAMFYRQAVLHNGIPFELKASNKETAKILDEVKKDKNREGVTIAEMMAERNR